MTGGYFSEAARSAARAARSRKAALRAEAKAHGELEVFAVRLENGYTWQVRKYGGIVVADGNQGFETASAAREAGFAAHQRRQPVVES